MMHSNSNELIAGLFSDSLNIQIICSIYENEVSAQMIANILSLDEEDISRHLEILSSQFLVSKKQRGKEMVYSLINPKVCDSILMLRDAVEHK